MLIFAFTRTKPPINQQNPHSVYYSRNKSPVDSRETETVWNGEKSKPSCTGLLNNQLRLKWRKSQHCFLYSNMTARLKNPSEWPSLSHQVLRCFAWVGVLYFSYMCVVPWQSLILQQTYLHRELVLFQDPQGVQNLPPQTDGSLGWVPPVPAWMNDRTTASRVCSGVYFIFFFKLFACYLICFSSSFLHSQSGTQPRVKKPRTRAGLGGTGCLTAARKMHLVQTVFSNLIPLRG